MESTAILDADTYEQLFYVADVKIAQGFSRDLYISLGEHILTLMFPVRSSGMQRLIGLVPSELSYREKLGFEDIRTQVEPLLDIKVSRVNWFSSYRVHHHIADKFRVEHAFAVLSSLEISGPDMLTSLDVFIHVRDGGCELPYARIDGGIEDFGAARRFALGPRGF